MGKFWNMNRDADEGYLTLFGEISDATWLGDEITPRMFKQELDDLGDITLLNVCVNSGGGDVFAGQTIYNILKNHKAHKVGRIEGLAASIASVIVMACDEIIMPENAMMMIHEAWSGAVGNKRDLRKMADTLDVIDSTIRGIYAARTGMDPDAIADMMAEETWLTAADAAAMGFCDEVEENKKIAASVMKNGKAIINGVEIDLAKFRNAIPVFSDIAKDEDEEKKKRKAAPVEEYDDSEGDDAGDGDAATASDADEDEKKKRKAAPAEEDDDEEEAEPDGDDAPASGKKKKEHCNGASQQPVDADRKMIERRRALIAALID